jgi:hypothetical protein
MNLLTVTCNRDKQQIILQAESMDKFVTNPVTHYIIVNEDQCDLTEWYFELKPFYSKHRIVLLNKLKGSDYGDKVIDNSDDSLGWHSQQIQKLLFAFYLKEDYLITDSKNFFIKPVDLSIYNDNDYTASPVIPISKLGTWVVTAKLYADFFNRKLLTHYPPINPPFKINHKFITESDSTLLTKDTLPEALFYPTTAKELPYNNPSEFLFYSYLIPKHHPIWRQSSDLPQLLSSTINNTDVQGMTEQKIVEYLLEKLIFSNTVVAAVHKTILDNKNIDTSAIDIVELVNFILKNKFEFKTKLNYFTNDIKSL